MNILDEIIKEFSLTKYTNNKANKNNLLLVDFDTEIISFTITENDELSKSFGLVGMGELKINDYDNSEFDRIDNFGDLHFVLTPNNLFIIEYYLIGGIAQKLTGNEIKQFLKSYISKRLTKKELILDNENYSEWLNFWIQLELLLDIESLTFERFVKFEIFNQIMKNGTKNKFSKAECFGFVCRNKTNKRDTFHVVFSLEPNDQNIVSICIKAINSINSVYQNFLFYNSKYPVQKYSHKNQPQDLSKIIEYNLDYYNIVEIDDYAGFINIHQER